MWKLYLLLVLSLFAGIRLSAQVTLDECVKLAQDNYPLIRKYDLLELTKEVNLSDINKSWLPQINVYGQGTVQNETPSFPESLAGIISQTGMSISGLNEWQYKVGADISQNIWDGGASKTGRKIERAENAERQAALDVQLYAIRERVEDLYFKTCISASCSLRNRPDRFGTCKLYSKATLTSCGRCMRMVPPCKAMWIWWKRSISAMLSSSFRRKVHRKVIGRCLKYSRGGVLSGKN